MQVVPAPRAALHRLRAVVTRALAHVALVVLGATIGLAVSEGLVRVLLPQESAYTGHGLFRPDAEVGHCLAPGVSSGGIRINSLGLRGREVPAAKPPGVYRVLGLGDSFTFGRRSPDEVYLERLAEHLDGAGLDGRVEILNGAVPGYSTLQELRWLRRFGLALAPDLVVLGLFVTGDVIENASDTVYDVVDGELTTRALSRRERFLRRWHLYRLIKARLTVHAAERPPGGLDHARYLAVEWDRLQVCRRLEDRRSRQGLGQTKRLLLELRDLLRERGVLLTVLLIPDEVQVDPAVLAEVLSGNRASPADFDLDLPNKNLREFLVAEGVTVVDILADCRRRHRDEPVYIPQDTHLNAAGHAIAAERLAEQLLPGLTATLAARRKGGDIIPAP